LSIKRRLSRAFFIGKRRLKMAKGPGRPPQHDGHGDEPVRRMTDQKEITGRMLKGVIDTSRQAWCIAKGIERLRWIMARGKEEKIKQIEINTIIVFLAVGSMAYNQIDNGVVIEEPDAKTSGTIKRRYRVDHGKFSLKEFPNCFNLVDPIKAQSSIRDSPLEKKFKNELDFLIKEGLVFEDTEDTDTWGKIPVLRLTAYGDTARFQFMIDIQEDWPRIPEGEVHKVVADLIVAGKPYGEKNGLPKDYGDRQEKTDSIPNPPPLSKLPQNESHTATTK
jgi:hypothetical protein